MSEPGAQTDADETARVTETLVEAAGGLFVRGFDGVIRVEATDKGASFWVDGRGPRAIVAASAPSAVDGAFCLWRAKHETLTRLFAERGRRVDSAFVSNRLQISGDMAVMARLEVGPDAA